MTIQRIRTTIERAFGDRARRDRREGGRLRHEIIEVSLFGPCYGESVVIHLGRNRWMIVDSCLDRDGQPAALAYLRSIGVDPVTDVVAIVVSHWDDDHVQGIGLIVRECRSAKVWLPSACQLEEIWAYVGSDLLPTPAGFRELKKVMDALAERLPRRAPPGAKAEIAVADVAIHDAQLESGDPSVKIWTLSPGAQDTMVGLRRLKILIDNAYPKSKPVGRLNQNEFSVVLHLEIGRQRILLGGDRLNVPATRGWQSVAGRHQRRGLGRSHLYKVAHHGSKTGDHATIWTDLTERPLVSILTPNTKSGGLPQRDDVVRICARSDVVAITSYHELPETEERVSEFTIHDEIDYATDESKVEDSAAQAPMGHVRCRASARGGRWEVLTPIPARRLK